MSRIRIRIPRTAVGAVASACLAVTLLLTQPVAAEAAVGKPARVVAGYSGEQLASARVILAVAAARHLPVAAAVLGVATAMGESSLRNLPYGDGAINPDGTVADSVGLFQQQHWWGTRAQRMTPSYAAGAFFSHLVRVPGWEGRTPTAAIHAVQRNADPGYYTRFLPAALEVVHYLVAHPAKVVDSSRPAAGTSAVKGHGTAAAPKAPTAKAASPKDDAASPSAGQQPRTARELGQQPLTAADLGLESLDSIDLGDWATGWDLGDLGDAISGAVTDGLGSAGGTVPEEPATAP